MSIGAIAFMEELKHTQTGKYAQGWLDEAIEALKLIPDNATNGDVIKALFPNVAYEEYEDKHLHVILMWLSDFLSFDFDWTWWNAPYKREGEQK